MIFHADSESDLKTTPNHVKNQILIKILFLWYFDLKFPYGFSASQVVFYFAGGLRPPDPPYGAPGGGGHGAPGGKKREKSKNVKFPLKKHPKNRKSKFQK